MSTLHPNPPPEPHRSLDTQVARIERALDYTFRDKVHLKAALQMCDPVTGGLIDANPLEIAGCGLIELVVGRAIFEHRSRAPNGDLQGTCEQLTNKYSLKQIGDKLELHRGIHPLPVTPVMDLQWGKTRNGQILTSVIEAIRRDSNVALASAVTQKLFGAVAEFVSMCEKPLSFSERSVQEKSKADADGLFERFTRFLKHPFY